MLALGRVVVELGRGSAFDFIAGEPDEICQVAVRIQNLAVTQPGNNVRNRRRFHEARELLLRLALPPPELRVLEGLVDRDLHLVQGDGLDEKALGALRDCLDRERDRRMGGEQHERHVGIARLNFGEDVEPVHPGHVQIADNELVPFSV